jgi:hypothetical protein
LPRALWFFYAAPPSDLRLAVGAPGYGWKASALDALQPAGLAALPLAALAAPAMHSHWLYRRIWPFFEHRFRISERLLDVDMTAWHDYVLDWRLESATFLVDGRSTLVASAPQGPLGLVVWIDNQYMVVHPTGRLRYGLVAKSKTQWMEIDDLHLEM